MADGRTQSPLPVPSFASMNMVDELLASCTCDPGVPWPDVRCPVDGLAAFLRPLASSCLCGDPGDCAGRHA